MAQEPENPLISASNGESGLTVSLHPLVLLTISDQITRYQIRKESGPIIGALLGEQKGREVTAEHAFAMKVGNDGGIWTVDQGWMEQRLQQCLCDLS